jgi:hypothetical protein
MRRKKRVRFTLNSDRKNGSSQKAVSALPLEADISGCTSPSPGYLVDSLGTCRAECRILSAIYVFRSVTRRTRYFRGDRRQQSQANVDHGGLCLDSRNL